MAWARKELEKALFPLWSCACAADLAAALAQTPDGNTPAPLRTGADPKKPVLCFASLKPSVCAAVESLLASTLSESAPSSRVERTRRVTRQMILI